MKTRKLKSGVYVLDVLARKAGFTGYNTYLQSDHWLSFRRRVFARSRKCKVCSLKADVVHHKSYERLGHEDLSDVEALCYDCHDKVHALHRKHRIPLAEFAKIVEMLRGTRKAPRRRKRVRSKAQKITSVKKIANPIMPCDVRDDPAKFLPRQPPPVFIPAPLVQSKATSTNSTWSPRPGLEAHPSGLGDYILEGDEAVLNHYQRMIDIAGGIWDAVAEKWFVSHKVALFLGATVKP